DTILWLTQAMKNAGADLAVVLRANAVNYAVRGQDASGLAFGDVAQTQPPRPAEDVARLIGSGVPVFCVREDLAARAIAPRDLADGLHLVDRAALPECFARYDRVWYW